MILPYDANRGGCNFRKGQREDEQELLALLRPLRRHPLDTAGLTLERAAILKFLSDAYRIRRFETMAQKT
jgi:hypothetical protein